MSEDNQNRQPGNPKDLDTTMQESAQVAKAAGGLAKKAKNKIKDTPQKIQDSVINNASNNSGLNQRKTEDSGKKNKKKIKGANSGGKKPGTRVGKTEKAKAKAYQAKGSAKMSTGGAEIGAGAGAVAAGAAAQAAGAGLKGLASAVSLIPYAGKVIAKPIDALGKASEKAGKTATKQGKKIIKRGTKNIKQGMRDIKKGIQLETTGKDPGGGKSGGLPGNSMGNVQMPHIPGIKDLKSAFVQAGKKLKKRVIRTVLIAVAIVFAVIMIVLINEESEKEDASYDDGNLGNVPYVISSMVFDEIVIVQDSTGNYVYTFENEDGEYLTLDEAVNEAIDTLEMNGTSLNYLAGGKEYNDITDRVEVVELLEKMIKAEIATQYPDISYNEDLGLSGADNITISSTSSNSDTDSDEDADEDSDEDSDEDTDEDADEDTDEDSDEDADEDSDEDSDEDAEEDTSSDSTSVDDIINNMTLEEKIYQLFMVQTSVSGTEYSDTNYGGIIMNNGKGGDYSMASSIGTESDIAPFIATDDEGGSVSRAYTGGQDAHDYNGDTDAIYSDEVTKTEYLLDLGINVNLGPVTDTISDSNGALYSRSYGGDSETVKKSIEAVISAREDTTSTEGITMSSVLKHYPGYGNESDNTDKGSVTSSASESEINESIDVFLDGISAGANAVMVSNIIYSNLDSSNPASMSSTIISELRSNFDGVIMTDDIGNAASVSGISNRYSKALIAGNDMILMDIGNVDEAYSQVSAAVSDGSLTEDEINEKVKRILNWKSEAGILDATSGSSTTTTTKVTGEGTGNITIDKEIKESETMQGGIKVVRKDENGNESDLIYTSTKNFNALISSNNETALNYYTMVKTSETTSTSSSGSASATEFWLLAVSYENWSAYDYHTGISGLDYNSDKYIYNYVTEDGENYIVTYTGGYHYAGPGVQLESNIDLFAAEGIDVNTLSTGSYINCEIVDKVSQEAQQNMIDWVKKDAETNGVTLTENQYQAVADIYYTWGPTSSTAAAFWTAYAQYGDTEELAQNYDGFTYVSENATESDLLSGSAGRPQSRWLLFEYGIYLSNNPYFNNYINSGEFSTSTSSSSSSSSTSVTSLDNFLFIGDSRFVGIKSELENLGSGISVCAKGSSTPSQWAAVAETGSGTVLSESFTFPESPSGICIQLGVNGANGSNQVSDMKTLLNNLNALYPDVPIFVTSVYHVGTAYTGGVTNESIDSFNDAVQDFCNQNTWAYYIDVLEGLDDDLGNLKAEYSSDGLHLSSTEGKNAFISNIENAILNSSVSDTLTTETAGTTYSGYQIVVANVKAVTTTTVVEYNYASSYYYDSDKGYYYGSKYFATPGPDTDTTTQTTVTSSSSPYQEALQNYTLYFDFLWAVLVNTNDTELIEDWANLVLDNGKDDPVKLTVYTDTTTKTTTSSASDGTHTEKAYFGSSGLISVSETYNKVKTTTVTTVEKDAKLAITQAYTWLIDYENDADTYDEYKNKTCENIVEKIDESSSEANVISILKEDQERLSVMLSEENIVEEALESNDKVSFMVDIYDYILEIASGGDETETTLSELLDVSSFNLETFKTTLGSSTALGEMNGTFLEVALQCHQYVRENGFTYSQQVRNIPVSSSATTIDCSTYVCWALYEYGYTELEGTAKSCSAYTFIPWCRENLELVWSGFTHNITDVSEIQPGDIVILGYDGTSDYGTHTQIFVGYDDNGNAIWYNCGTTGSIQKEEGVSGKNEDSYQGRGFTYVFRVPTN